MFIQIKTEIQGMFLEMNKQRVRECIGQIMVHDAF